MPFLFSPRSSALRRPTKTLFSVEPTALYSSLPLFLFFSLFLSLSVCARIPAIHAVYTTEQRLDALARTCSVQREITRMLAIMKTSRRRTSADNYREPTLQPSKGLNVKRYTSGHHYGSFYAPATRGSFSPPPFHLSLSLFLSLSLSLCSTVSTVHPHVLSSLSFVASLSRPPSSRCRSSRVAFLMARHRGLRAGQQCTSGFSRMLEAPYKYRFFDVERFRGRAL